jgi:glycine/D-amino acid oxidase-like deaminating enzyme
MQGDISLWDKTAAEDATGRQGDVSGKVDVAIVGAGYTGLSTALHAAEKGLSAHVIEAQQIGYGGSGRNSGLVNAGVWLPPATVREKLGAKYGDHFLKVFSDAPREVFELIEKHQIQCEATRTGTIHAAHAPSGLANLAGRAATWVEMGAPVRLLSADEMAEMFGSREYQGGLLDERAGTINPMGYARGLARAALAAGAEITVGTHVTGLQRDGGGWRVLTHRGDIRAKTVVLGTNAYTDRLWPGLRSMFTTLRIFNFATAPLGDRAAQILPGRQGLWDTGPILRNFRRDAFGRLIVGTLGRVMGDTHSGLSRKWAARQVARVFPELGPVEFQDAWSGQVAMTPDHLPKIVRLDTGIYTPICYNGRGITTGTVFGRAMADLLTGADEADLPLPVTGIKPMFAPRLREAAYDLAFAANQVWHGVLRA